MEDGGSAARTGSPVQAAEMFDVFEMIRRLEPGAWTGNAPTGSTHGSHRRTDAKVADGDRLKLQILILEEQKKELLLVNEKWAREYRTMKRFYSEKVRELRTLLQLDISHEEKETSAQTRIRDEESAKAEAEMLEDVWKHQAEVYREDFLKERSDREKLHGRYLELEKKYRRACRELQALQPQTPPTKAVAERRSRSPPRSQNLGGQPQHKPASALNFMRH